ncbi:MAG: DUF2075 domain-containing protein [Chlamydiia bacterium]|nr:DUF2075 domain-containing protein [Chlamydiia bacterium]
MGELDENVQPADDGTQISTEDATTSGKEVKITKQNVDNINDSVDSDADFGSLLMDGWSEEALANTFGTDLKMKSKDDYWKDPKIQKDFKKIYGEGPDADEKFDQFYMGIQGKFSKYTQDNFEIDRFNRSLTATSLSGGAVNKEKAGKNTYVQFLDKTVSGAVKFNGDFVGQERSVRQAMAQKVTLTVGEDSNGNPIEKTFDLTPELREELQDVEGFDGFAYDQEVMGQGIGYRGKAAVKAIVNGQVWDAKLNKFKDVHSSQLVSDWDLEPETLLGKMLSGNDMAMEGFEYAKLLLRSPLNTAIEFLDIIPQVGRSIMGVYYGNEAKDKELYRKLTGWGIGLKSLKGSSSDQAMQGGFFGSAEVFVSTIADVAAQLVLAGGIGKGVKALTGGMGVGNATRFSLTMMAAKDMYQEALENGFSEQEAGIAMGAAVFAMWKANSYSSHLISGVEPNAMRHFSKRVAQRELGPLMTQFRKTAATKGKDAATKGLMEGAGKAYTGMNNLMRKAQDFVHSNDVWYSMVEEATEEVLEELSTEGVRQMLNGYKAMRGVNLQELAVGKGRFKSYWDHGYWAELKENLLVSGIAGGLGGPMGKVIHGGLSVSKFSDKSTLLDYALANGGVKVMQEAINEAANEYAYGPEGMSTEMEPITNTFKMYNGGESMNETARKTLQQDLLVISTVVDELGLRNNSILENDPELKANLSKTSLTSDLKEVSENIITIMEDTGIGSEAIKAIQDNDIDQALIEAKDANQVHQQQLIEKTVILKSRFDELKAAKDQIDGNTKDGEKSKFTEEQQELLDAAKEEYNDAKLKEDKADSGLLTKEKMVELSKELVKARGITNGSAAEKYYLQHTLHDNPVFGTQQNRAPDFMGMSDDFFAESFDNARQSMGLEMTKQADRYQKMLENDKRIQTMTPENVADFVDMFNDTPYMSMDSVRKIKEIKESIDADDTSIDTLKNYLGSDEYIDGMLTALEENLDKYTFTTMTRSNADGTQTTVSLAADGTDKKFVDFLRSSDFKDMYSQIVKKNAAGITSMDNIRMTFLSMSDMKAMSDRFIMDTSSAAWSNAVHIEGELNFIDMTRKESFLVNTLGFEELPDDNVVFVGGRLVKKGTVQDMETGLNKTPAILNITKRIEGIQNSDPRKQIINGFDKAVTGEVSTNENVSTEEQISLQEFIDIEAPSLLSPYSLEWLNYEVLPGGGKGINSSTGDIFDKIVDIERTMDTDRDPGKSWAKKFGLSAAAKSKMDSLYKSVMIRKAQRDVLSMLFQGQAVHKIANFRKNTLYILGDTKYPYSPTFSQEEKHNYKNNTVLSDFTNDFGFDAIELSDILRKLEQGSPLTKEEQEKKIRADRYSMQLRPKEVSYDSAGNEIFVVKDIESDEELHNAMDFMMATESLDQAEEIIIGINKLVNENPIGSVQKEGAEFTQMRKDGVKKKLLDYTSSSTTPITYIVDALDQAGEDIPDGLRNFSDFITSSNGSVTGGLETDADFKKAEELLFRFFEVLPEIKDKLGSDKWNKMYLGEDNVMTQDMLLFANMGTDKTLFDIKTFYTNYLTKVDEMFKDVGILPTFEQEQNAVQINAFLGTDGPVKVANSTANDTTITLFVNGEAGSGKTHVVANLGLSLAQDTHAKKYGKEKAKVIYASRYQSQIDNLKAGLGNVETSGNGLDKDGLVQLLTEYIAHYADADNAAVKTINESFVIMFDEATQLNTQTSTDTDGTALKDIIALIEQVNTLKKANLPDSPSLKLILMGDTKQSGYKDPNSRIITGLDSISDHLNFITPPRMTYNFRATNKYLRKGLQVIQSLSETSLNRFSVEWGGNETENDKWAGVQLTNYTDNDFNRALDDEKLAKSIRMQIGLDSKFKVGIIPDDVTKIDNSTHIGRLIAEFPANVLVYSTREVQGLEFNYVITEFTNEYVGNFSTASSKIELEKDMYTLMSRARDYVKVVNSNNTPITSKYNPTRPLIQSGKEKLAKQQKAYDFLFDVYGPITGVSPDQKSDPEEDENKEDDEDDEGEPCPTGAGDPAFASGGKLKGRGRGRACIINIPNVSSVTVMSKDYESELTAAYAQIEKMSPGKIPAFKKLLKLPREARANLLSNPNEGKTKVLRDLLVQGGDKLNALLESLDRKKDQKDDNNKARIDDIILQEALNQGTPLNNVNDKKAFADKIIRKIKADDSIDVNMNSYELVAFLQTAISANIDNFVNIGDGTQTELYNPEKNGTVYTNPSLKGTTKVEYVEVKYKELMQKFKSTQKIYDRIDELEEEIGKNKNNIKAVEEYTELTAIMEQTAQIPNLLPAIIIPSFTDLSKGEGGRINVGEDSTTGEMVNTTKALIVRAKQNQLKFRGGESKVTFLRPKKEHIQFLVKNGIISDKVLTTDDAVHSALYSGQLVKVKLVGKPVRSYDRVKRRATMNTNAALIGVLANGVEVLLGKPFLGELDNTALFDLHKNIDDVNESVGLRDDRALVSMDFDTPSIVSAKLFPASTALKDQIELGGIGSFFSKEIPLDEFRRNTTVGSGSVQDSADNRAKSLRKLREDMRKNGNDLTRISSVILINNSGLIPGVKKGGAFTIYTTDPHINGFDNPETVLGYLNTLTSNNGVFSKGMSSVNNVKANIGILPLNSKPLSLNELYSKNTDTFKHGGSPVENIQNKMLSKREETHKIASVFKSFVGKILTDTTGVATSITSADQNKNDFNFEMVAQEIQGHDIFKKPIYSGDSTNNVSPEVSDDAYNDVKKKLKTDSTDILSQNDLLSAIVMPFARNYSKEIFTKTQGTSYIANYWSMNKSFDKTTVNDEGETVKTGKTVTDFNVLNMLGAIHKEIAIRIKIKNPKMSSDTANDLAKNYMENYVLPVLSEMYASTEVYNKHSDNTTDGTLTEITLPNNEKVFARAKFSTEVLSNIKFSKTNNPHFFVAASNGLNNSILETTAGGFKFPGVEFNVDNVLKELTNTEGNTEFVDGYQQKQITNQERFEAKLSSLTTLADKGLSTISDEDFAGFTAVVDTFDLDVINQFLEANVDSLEDRIQYTDIIKSLQAANDIEKNRRLGTNNQDKKKVEDIEKRYSTKITLAIDSLDLDSLEEASDDLNNKIADAYANDSVTDEYQSALSAVVHKLNSVIDGAKDDIQNTVLLMEGEIFNVVEDINNNVFSPDKANVLSKKINSLKPGVVKDSLLTKFEKAVKYAPGYNQNLQAEAASIENFYKNLFAFFELNGFSVNDADILVTKLAAKELAYSANPTEVAAAMAEAVSFMLQNKPEYKEMVALYADSEGYIEAAEAAIEDYKKDNNLTEIDANTEANVKSELDRKYVAKLLEDAYNFKYSEEATMNASESFLDALHDFMINLVEMFKGISPDAHTKITQIASTIAEESLEDTENLFSIKKQDGYIEVNFQTAFDEDPVAMKYQLAMNDIPGTTLTGSIALAAQGTVYRPEGNQVHDLDYVSSLSKTLLRAEIAARHPNAVLANDFSAKAADVNIFIIPQGDNTISDVEYGFYAPKIRWKDGKPDSIIEGTKVYYSNTPDAYGNINYPGTKEMIEFFKSKNEAIRPKITAYKTLNADGEPIMQYANFYDYKTKSRQEKHIPLNGADPTTSKSMLIDFFTSKDGVPPVPSTQVDLTTPTGEVKKMNIVRFDTILEAKIDSSRYKDIIDFKNYVSYAGTRDDVVTEDVATMFISGESAGEGVIDLPTGMSISLAGGAVQILTKDQNGYTTNDAYNSDALIQDALTSNLTAETVQLINAWKSSSKNDDDNGKTIAKRFNAIHKKLNGNKLRVINIWAGSSITKDVNNISLSNIAPRKFSYKLLGKSFTFDSVEHAFQIAKLMYGDSYYDVDKDSGEKTFNAEGLRMIAEGQSLTPFEVKKWGGKYGSVILTDADGFNADAAALMKNFMLESFRKNKDAKNLLMNTLDSIFTHGPNANTAASVAIGNKDRWLKEFPEILSKVRILLNEEMAEDNKDAYDIENILEDSIFTDTLETNEIQIINNILNTLPNTTDVVNALDTLKKLDADADGFTDAFKEATSLFTALESHSAGGKYSDAIIEALVRCN